jgi:hypothetical protein
MDLKEDRNIVIPCISEEMLKGGLEVFYETSPDYESPEFIVSEIFRVMFDIMTKHDPKNTD